MNNVKQRKNCMLRFALCVVVLLLFLLPLVGKGKKQGGMYEAKAEGKSSATFVDIKIERLNVDVEVFSSRKVRVENQVTVTFLRSGLSMFYCSLPTDGCKYTDVFASCEGNPDFYYEVADNPDVSGFIDVNCIGGVQKGRTWTYTVGYTMEPSVPSKDGMIIDVVGFGSPSSILNVSVNMRFPAPVIENKVFVGKEEAGKDTYTLSEDKKSISIYRDALLVEYNEKYDERMAQGITVDFTLEKGGMVGYTKSRMFTAEMWKILLGAGGSVAVAVILLLCKKKRDMIIPVCIKPPKGMNPLQMGKILDGKADNEDITSMIYYFAHKGYLKIDFTDKKDPKLIRLYPELSKEAPLHERTLFNGLFEGAKLEEEGEYKGLRAACVSELVAKFYRASETAKYQLEPIKPMYDTASKVAFAAGGVLGVLFAFIACLLMGFNVGGGYFYPFGIFLALPVCAVMALGGIRENYRYKWSSGKRWGFFVLEVALCLLCSLIFIFAFGEHLMTEWEKLVVCLGALLPPLLTEGVLTRTQTYVDTLGEILGYKEFITVTEEDKIRFMLEENPELYYEVLPYAQVLGVTEEWEKKFANITMQPPTWYVGDITLFDYMLLRYCMTRCIMNAMIEEAMRDRGGAKIGRGGGGGSFGSFGGGGFGGGGFGAR